MIDLDWRCYGHTTQIVEPDGNLEGLFIGFFFVEYNNLWRKGEETCSSRATLIVDFDRFFHVAKPAPLGILVDVFQS